MSTNNVPDLLSNSNLSRTVALLKSRTNITRTETVTGRFNDVTAAFKGDIGGGQLLMKAINDAKAFQQNLSIAEIRTQKTQNVLGVVAGDANVIATKALAAVGRADEVVMRSEAKTARVAISSIFASLNTTDGARALFGGDDSDRPPLASPDQLIADIELIMASAVDAADVQAQLDTYFNDPAGGFAATIYQGGANPAPAVEIAPGIRVNASVKADDPIIKDLIRGLAEMATFESAAFADKGSIMETGATRTIGAETQLTELRGAIGASEAQIAAAKERFVSEESVLTSLYNEKTLRDPYEAASELQFLETQLEASFLLTSRLARLTISNFIR